MSMKDIEKHASWEHINDVQEICKSLFDLLGINYFDYARVYKNGALSLLYSDAKWAKTFLNKFEYKSPTLSLPPGAHLWSDYIPAEQFATADKDFHHGCGITIISPHQEYDEIINFSGPSSNRNLIEFYLNNLDFLSNFRYYFLDKGKPIVDKVFSERIILPEREPIIKKTFTEIEPQLLEMVKNSALMVKYGLTKKELDCGNLLVKGLPIKCIADELHMSKRTVEKHIENLKIKMGCSKNTEVVLAFAANKL